MIRACRRKKKYPTKEEAQKRANVLWRRGVKVKVYKCRCGGWHLANANPRAKLDSAFKEAGR